MPWKPQYEGEIPTLGYVAIDWITEYLAAPDKLSGEPFTPYLEQEDFILRWYAINPETGRWLFNRALLGRPRGWGKSPLLAGLACCEALAPIVPGGWDANGQPVGRPWSSVRTPIVHIAAVSEKQVANTWDPLLEMLREGRASEDYAIDPMDTFVALPGKGAIRKLTASARTVKGGKPVFSVMDQTEEWVPGNGGVRLARVMLANAAKVGGRVMESPNAFIPGEGSVAESSAAYAAAQSDGRAKHVGLLYDHREAPSDTDMSDEESLTHGLRIAYGDSSGHPDGCLIHTPPCPPGHAALGPIIETIWDPTTDVQMVRSDFLNQITHASDSWISKPEWGARSIDTLALSGQVVAPLSDGDEIVLGFDGSRKRRSGMTDATALIACRVHDGLIAPMHIWEQPDGPDGDEWQVPTDEVNAEVADAHKRFKVVGFYADPAKWESFVAQWEARYSARYLVKASRSNPIEWWMTGGRSSMIHRALESFYGAVVDGELIHNGSVTLQRHILNARRRMKGDGYQIYKEHPDSINKIDAAIAAVLAWQARTDAIAAGAGKAHTRRAPRRLY